jgi:hypothetical protein
MGSLKIIEETRARAEQGNAEAQFKLGRMYAKGEGVPQDYVQAVAWFRKAAEQGNAKAQNGLGAMYGIGQGVPQDWVQAVVWFRKAAEQGEAMAQCNLGVRYDNGQGVPQDYAQAAGWYRKAAEQGYAEAQFNMGVMYANGEGVRQDYAQALVWYRKAAEQGYAAAQFNLGGMYDFGRGVPQDYVEAHMWRNLAAARATGEDKKKFEDGRDDLAKSMTPAQVTEAQKRAKEWTAQNAPGSTAVREDPAPGGVGNPPLEKVRPSIRITRMEIAPGKVKPGSKFDLKVQYAASDPSAERKTLTVRLTYAIYRQETLLFESAPIDVESINGGGTERKESINAAKNAGAYTMKVRLQYNDAVANDERAFTIE